jgi:hypothetical protein
MDEKMMETYKKFGSPEESHKWLKRMEGKWLVEGKYWMDSLKPPVESENSSEQEMVLGGRFLKQKYSGQMMGEEFSGIGFLGYNNISRMYESVWIDNMNTAMYFFEGNLEENGKALVVKGEADDPIKGPMKHRYITRIIDDNTLKTEMYATFKGGKEEKMMEETYTRKK